MFENKPAPFIRGMSPEERGVVLGSVRKSLGGEFGHYDENDVLQKDVTGNVGVTSGLGLMPIPLDAPAKLLYPILTPLRNMLPREVKGGPSTTFRSITGINTTGIWPSVAEAVAGGATGRNSAIAFNEVDKTVSFKTYGMENFLTPEAEFGGNYEGQNFNNREFSTLANLQSMMRAEELLMLHGNVSALGNVAGVAKTTVQPADTIGALTPSAHYFVYVSAVNGRGYAGASHGQVGGTDATGETTAAELDLTAAASGDGSTAIDITWTTKDKATAYNVFVGATTGIANAKYYATVTTPYYRILAAPGTGNRPNGADTTANALDFDGLYSLISAANGSYVKNYVDQPFTADGRGGVEEISAALKYMWVNYKVSPDFLLMHANERDAAGTTIAAATNPAARLNAQFGDGKLTGGISFSGVINPYFGDKIIPFLIHPDATPGVVAGVCQSLGEYYPQSGIAANFKMRMCWDYRREDFAKVRRGEEFGIYARGAMVNYAPFASFKITGLRSS
jgi:hypothetical protein